ncbi:hypothetical protein [uncultured Nostoc sp.]|uniref:hypothetical protein n=1 Tax=uncultured Nostoc sp. TaxID=340711 RepID=UPI0035CB27A2
MQTSRASDPRLLQEVGNLFVHNSFRTAIEPEQLNQQPKEKLVEISVKQAIAIGHLL